LTQTLDGLPLTEIIYPNFLCGPLNAIQRLTFIRYDMDGHFLQIIAVKKELNL